MAGPGIAPVTAVAAPGANRPVTAVLAPGMGWDSDDPPFDWGRAHVPYPRPPEWRRPTPPRRRWRLLRTLVVLATFVGLAPLLGVAALLVLQGNTATPGSGPTGGAAPPAAAPEAPANSDAPPPSVSPVPSATPDLATVVGAVNPGVVNINTTLGLQNARAAGTGVVLDASGLVLTNNHVIAGATSIVASSVTSGRSFQASVVGYDRSHDVAVLRLANATGLRRVTLGNSAGVKVNDQIIAIGNAGGDGGKPTVVTGRVTGLNRSITATDADGGSAQRLTGLIEVAADIRAGVSGGPLVDRSGRLVGINTAASVDADDLAAGGKGFAIPSNTAISIAEQIEAGKASDTIHIGQTALLGVSTTDANRGGPGATVTGVLSGGPAQRAGVATGDVIRTIDGRRITSSSDLVRVLDTRRPGDQIQLGWVDRSGNSRTATIRLAVGPAG
jgi:S1-C subfamily serine protease